MKMIVLSTFVMASAFAGNVTVNFPSIDGEGQVVLRIVNEAEYKADKGADERTEILGANEVSVATINNVAPGEYSALVYHDKNSNLKLDKNALGIPKENYGVVNLKIRPLSKPKFEKVKFTVGKDDLNLTIDKLF